jgi:hypothetical protein
MWLKVVPFEEAMDQVDIDSILQTSKSIFANEKRKRSGELKTLELRGEIWNPLTNPYMRERQYEIWCRWKNSENKYNPKYDREAYCEDKGIFFHEGDPYYFYDEGFDIYAKVWRWEELLKDNPNMTWDEAYGIHAAEKSLALHHHHIDTESTDADEDVGCPVEMMGPRFIHTDPKYNAATSPEEIQKKMDDYVNAMR